MKMRLLGICFLFWLATFALASAAQSSLEVERATVAGVELKSDGLARYDIWVSHAPTCDACPVWSQARKARDGAVFTDMRIYWIEQRLPHPAVGTCAWVGWCWSDGDSAGCDSVYRPVLGKAYYFPLVLRK